MRETSKKKKKTPNIALRVIGGKKKRQMKGDQNNARTRMLTFGHVEVQVAKVPTTNSLWGKIGNV